MTDGRTRAGALVLAVGSLGLAGASIAILSPGVDVATAGGRHRLAGALANVALSIVLALLAAFPLRRGERWAFFAYLVPVAVYGVPILAIDATHVRQAHLAATLAPQVAGLIVIALGLWLVGPAVRARGCGRATRPDT